MGKSTHQENEPARINGAPNLEKAFEAVNDAIIIANHGQQITFANTLAAYLFGYEPDDLPEKPLQVLLPGFQLPKGISKASRLLELTGLHKNGRYISVEASISPISNEKENEVLIILRDITERRKTEDLLKEVADKFQTVFESANVGKSITLPSGEISVNKAMAELIGYEREELTNKTWQSISPPEDVEPTNQILDRISRGETDSVRFEKRYIHKKGYHIWADVSAACRRNQAGQVLYFITTVVDISRQKQILEKLNESEERFRAIVEGSPDGFFIQMDNKFSFLNPSACRIFGIDSPDLLIGTPILDRIHPDYREKARERIRRLNEARESVKDLFELRFLRIDGSEIWVETSGEPIQIDNHKGALVVVRDVSKRKEAELAREESETRFRLLAESAPIGIIITDARYKTLYASPRFFEMFGYTLEEIPTLKDWGPLAFPDEKMHSEICAEWTAAIEQASLSENEVAPKVFQVVCKNGSVRQVEFRMKASGDYKFFIMTDVSERVAAENEIIRQKEIFQLFIEHSPAAIAMFDREMRYIAVSRRFMQDYDIPDLNLIGKCHYEIFPELPEAIKEVHRRCLAGAVESSEEAEFYRASGKIDYLRWEMRPWYEREGFIGGVILFSEVITQRRLAEKAAEKFTERLKILHAVDQAILQPGKDPASTARLALEKSCALLNCRQAAVGILDQDLKTIHIEYFDAEKGRHLKKEKQLDEDEMVELAGLRIGQIEVCEDAGNLAQRSFIASILEARDQGACVNVTLHSKESLVGLVSYGWKTPFTIQPEIVEIVVEVTREIAIAIEQANLRRATAAYAADLENKVRARTAELEASNKDLEAFAYSVSHDLRAPLRNIMSFSQILDEDYGSVLDDEGHRVLGIIQSSTRKMDQLITDLLALSRASRVQMDFKKINMTAIARSVMEELKGSGSRKKVTVKISRLPPCQADPTLIRQVWTNLISNAIKYTGPKPDGRIEISGACEGGECIYTIRDNGVGFDQTYKDHLFRIFQRLHKESEFEGTGVGLAIVHRIIQRHGGQIWAEGKVGEGAAFHFSIPTRGDF